MPRAVYGLTGGIASGKTTIATAFEHLGAVIIDADQIARQVVSPGTPGMVAVIKKFGLEVVVNGQLDRAALAKLIFADPEARVALNAIIHPLVRTRSQQLVANIPADQIVLQVIPLLVETNQVRSFDGVVVVDVPEQIQLTRLMLRDMISEQEALARIRAQASRESRLAAATWIIDNTVPPQQVTAKVKQVWQEMLVH